MIDVMKTIEALSNLAKYDYIVEAGTSGGWEYRKWNSGKSEAWREYTANIAISSASGNVYRSGGTTLGIHSGIFIGQPKVFGQLRGVFAWLANITIASAGTDFTFYLANGLSAASASRTIDFYIQGNWK